MGLGNEKRDGDPARTRRAAAPSVLAALAVLAVLAPSAHAAFGFKHTDLTVTDQEGTSTSQAGSHPFALTASLAYETEVHPSLGQIPVGQPRDLRIQLPPGLLGQASATPLCPLADFNSFVGGEVPLPNCPTSSAIGFATLEVALPERGTAGVPIFNLAPLPGHIARFGFGARNFSFAFDLALSHSPPYRLVAEARSISQQVGLLGATVTLWGDPSDPAHDGQRGPCGAYLEREGIRLEADPGGTCPTERNGQPFLTLPRSCAPVTATFEADSWAAPGAFISATAPEPLTPTGCGKLGFAPTFSAQPTTDASAAPSGLDLDLDLADEGLTSATGTAAADTAAASLQLPPGFTINPPIAAGLAACTTAQLAAELPDADPATGCPEAAKIGTATLTTPLFAKPIAGSIYVAAPNDNPFGSLLALYLILRDPERGLLLRLPIHLETDPASGRLTATFDHIPQFPLSHLELNFNTGLHAPLVTPPRCGAHPIDFELEPSSGSPPFGGIDAFTTSSGCENAFAPSLQAGTTSYAAGSDAPFVFELANDINAPNLESLSLTLPPGLAANLSAASACPEADTDTAGATCPGTSRLGYARIALGAGPEPLWVPDGTEPDADVYLAGPYRDAPYSLLISVPAAAGPYELGRVVLRAPVRVDPSTAQATVEVLDLPQIRDGIPLHYRAIRLVLDRPGFIRNPTSCEPTRITATATSAEGTVAPLSDRFQAADCAALAFRPRPSLRFSGSLARNGHPALRAVLQATSEEAGIAGAAFTLPPGELLDLRHLRVLCPRDLPADRCSPASVLGSVRLTSPMLSEPLQGPIYLREPSRRLPDLLADLQGGGVHLILHGHTTSPGGRLRISFPSLPDIPLSRAVITLPGGRQGIIANSHDLCAHRQRAFAALSAHNGKQITLKPKLRLPCWRLTVINTRRHPRPTG